MLILASSVGHFGWGTVLPYQYVYAAETRGWGAMTAAVASSLFSVGALVAAPFAGRLTDRRNPVSVMVGAQLLAALGVGSLLFVVGPRSFCAGTFLFGFGMAAATPAKSVLVLHWSGLDDRRRVFAYRFTAESVGIAIGAYASGSFVDLSQRSGMDISYACAVGALLLSLSLVAIAGVGASSHRVLGGDVHGGSARMGQSLRTIFAIPELRWVAVITVSLALAFYAQFEAGLPAYALMMLRVDEMTIGLAAAVNCIVIVALQFIVLRLTLRRGAGGLLMVVGAIWVLAWLVLSVAPFHLEIAATLFVTTYGIFAVGETMYSPVLNPLTAKLAPPGLVGTTLGTLAAMQTTFSALGPLVAGVLLGAGLFHGFLGLHLAISVGAFLAAWRLRQLLRRGPSPATPATVARKRAQVDGMRSRQAMRGPARTGWLRSRWRGSSSGIS